MNRKSKKEKNKLTDSYFNFKALKLEDEIKEFINGLISKYEIKNCIKKKIARTDKINLKEISKEREKLEKYLTGLFLKCIPRAVFYEIKEFSQKKSVEYKYIYNDGYEFHRIYLNTLKFLMEKLGIISGYKTQRYIGLLRRAFLYTLIKKSNDMFTKIHDSIYLMIYQQIYDLIKESAINKLSFYSTIKKNIKSENELVLRIMYSFFTNILLSSDLIYVRNFITFVRTGFRQAHTYLRLGIHTEIKTVTKDEYEENTKSVLSHTDDETDISSINDEFGITSKIIKKIEPIFPKPTAARLLEKII